MPVTNFNFVYPNVPYHSRTHFTSRPLSIEKVPEWLAAAHGQLTHLKCKGIKTLAATGGLKMTREQKKQLDMTTRIPCKHCDNAAITAKPVPKARADPPLERRAGVVNADLSGQYIASAGGKHWILGIKEQHSGVTALAFLKNKGTDVPDGIKRAILELQEKYRVRVTVLKSDRGGEFINRTVEEWLHEQGIRHEPTSAESPQKNGIIERHWGIIIPRAKAMLAAADVLGGRG